MKALDKAIGPLLDLKRVLEDELEELNRSKVRRSPRSLPPLPSPEQMKLEYENLLRSFAENGGEALREFVQGHSGRHLDAFIRANDLPLEVRRSKAEVERELRYQLMHSLVIRGKDSPVGEGH